MSVNTNYDVRKSTIMRDGSQIPDEESETLAALNGFKNAKALIICYSGMRLMVHIKTMRIIGWNKL